MISENIEYSESILNLSLIVSVLFFSILLAIRAFQIEKRYKLRLIDWVTWVFIYFVICTFMIYSNCKSINELEELKKYGKISQATVISEFWEVKGKGKKDKMVSIKYIANNFEYFNDIKNKEVKIGEKYEMRYSTRNPLIFRIELKNKLGIDSTLIKY